MNELDSKLLKSRLTDMTKSTYQRLSLDDLWHELGIEEHVITPKKDVLEFFKLHNKQEELFHNLKQKLYSLKDIIFILKKLNFNMSLLTERGKDEHSSTSFRPLEIMIKAVRFMHDELADESLENQSIMHLTRAQVCKMFGVQMRDSPQTSRDLTIRGSN